MRHVRFLRLASLSLALSAAPIIRADVTLRYESKATLNPNLPQQLAGPMTAGLTTSLPPTSVQQYRNGKFYYSSGRQKSILDVGKREITVLDSEGMRYATAPVEQYAEEASRLVTAATGQANAALAMMKGHSESTVTGQKATIQGLEADERNIVMTMDLSMAPGQPATPMVRMVMHVWTAKRSEAARNPALREVAGYNVQAFDTVNPVGLMEKAFKQIPGFGDGFASLVKDLQSGNVLMRMQMDLFVPMLGALMKQMPAGNGNPLGAGFDPNAALMQMTYELTEISADPVPDSVFQIPQGYQSSTVADILASLTPKAPVPEATLLKRVEPVYPPLAKTARVQGTVSFHATIAKDGTVKDLQLVSGPPLLVQAATDAVKQWVYKPTLQNGMPVEAITTINLNFSLSPPDSPTPAK